MSLKQSRISQPVSEKIIQSFYILLWRCVTTPAEHMTKRFKLSSWLEKGGESVHCHHYSYQPNITQQVRGVYLCVAENCKPGLVYGQAQPCQNEVKEPLNYFLKCPLVRVEQVKVLDQHSGKVKVMFFDEFVQVFTSQQTLSNMRANWGCQRVA